MSLNHVDRMAEFKAVLTASFDDIGSGLVNNNSTTNSTHSPRPTQHPHSLDKGTRSTALSFLRKVKTHASSLLISQARPASDYESASSPRSFVPTLPLPRSPTPSALASTFLTRSMRMPPYAPDVPPDSERISSFFDDDDDGSYANRHVTPPTRRINLPPARHNSRLSSAIAAAPFLFGFSTPSVPPSHLAAEEREVVKPEPRRELVHQASKSSLRLKLRTKLSLPKIASPRSHHSSPSSDPSPVSPSYHYHPYSAVFADSERTRPRHALFGDRSITPEEDPFRKDEVFPHLLATPRLANDAPLRSGLLDSDSETDEQTMGSSSLPMASSRWPSDFGSPPPCPKRTLVASGRLGSAPRPTDQNLPRPSAVSLEGPSRSPLSLTFPLPPAQKLAGVTVRVAGPTSGPPPAYPPPPTPPPCGALPRPPPTDANTTSRGRPSAISQKDVPERRSLPDSMPKSTRTEQTQPRRSFLQIDEPLLAPLEERFNAAKGTKQKATRRRGRPLTPFPLLVPTPAGRTNRDLTGRLEAPNVGAPFTCPSAFNQNQNADAISDSEVEPDRDFNSDKARKKTSVSSATSAQTTGSSISTTSASTTTSFVSTMTAATTVSPSSSPQISTDKPRHVSQVLITDEEGNAVSPTMYSTPSSRLSTPLTDSDARSSRIHVEQGGTIIQGASRDLFLAPGEQVIISAPGWVEFCDTCQDISLCLAGNTNGDSVADVLVVEIQRTGKMCGIELRIVARTPSPPMSADFPGRIPGTYPLSSDFSSPLPAVSCVSPIDIPQSTWSRWRRGALGLEGVPALHGAGPSHSGSRLGSRLDSAHRAGDQQRTMLAFTATLPTTLRDLAKRAGDMSPLDGVTTP